MMGGKCLQNNGRIGRRGKKKKEREKERERERERERRRRRRRRLKSKREANAESKTLNLLAESKKLQGNLTKGRGPIFSTHSLNNKKKGEKEMAGYHEVVYDDGDQYRGEWNADGKVCERMQRNGVEG